MKKRVSSLVATMLLLSTYSLNTHSAGFDCRNQNLSTTEKMICSDTELSALDDKLNASFKDLLSESNEKGKKEILKIQRQWVNETRNNCIKEPEYNQTFCLFESYRSRIAELNSDYMEARADNMLNKELTELSRRSNMTPEQIKEWLSDCDTSQIGMNICSYLYSLHSELAMDLLLTQKIKLLPPTCQARLQADQNKWKDDALNKCSKIAEDEAGGGSMEALIENGCLQAEKESRTAYLRTITSCNSLP